MTFTVKIALQPFEVAFEAGSIAEAVAILTEPDNELSKLAALANGTATDDGSEEPAGDAPVAEKPAPAKRGRKTKAAPEAVAPPPMPVPDAAPPPAPVAPAPVDACPIPPFLDRTTGAAAPTLAPPPPAPAPAPAAPPPVGVLGPKVIAELNRRKEGQPDQGAGLIAWLAGAGLVVPSATWDEAMLCIQFLDDAKLGPVAAGLQIA